MRQASILGRCDITPIDPSGRGSGLAWGFSRNRSSLGTNRAQRSSHLKGKSPGPAQGFGPLKRKETTKRKKGNAMNMRTLFQLVIVMGGLCAINAKPPRMPVYYEDQIVTMTVVNDNVLGVKEKDQANILYSFGPPGDQPQFDVITIVPGEAGYNPLWEEIAVVVLNGRDVTTDPFTSEDEILEAAENNEVMLVETEFYFLCQILPGVKTN